MNRDMEKKGIVLRELRCRTAAELPAPELLDCRRCTPGAEKSGRGGDPITLKAPVSEGDPSPGASTGSASLTRSRCPPDRLQKQIVGLTDVRPTICGGGQQHRPAKKKKKRSARVSLSADREAYGPEEAARWLAVSRFSSAILQLCQPIAVSAGRHMAWATMILRVIWLSHTAVAERERASLVQGPLAPDGLFGPRFSEVLAHQQSVRENRSRFGAILTRSSHQQAGRRRGPGRFQDSSPGAAAAAAAAAASATDRVAVGRRVHMASGSPASKKRRPLEPLVARARGYGRLYRSPSSPHYRNVTALSTMRRLGLMAAAHPVVPLGLLFMRRLQRWFARQRLDPRRHKLRVLLVFPFGVARPGILEKTLRPSQGRPT
ncbi:unnamed protein product [Boreogadus saida]